MNDVTLSLLRNSFSHLLLISVASCFGAVPAVAQDDDAPPNGANGAPAVEERDPVTNRRVHDGEPIYLSFNNVAIKDTLDFIVETTGKTVIPNATALTYKINIISDVPMSRYEALDRLFVSFLDFGVGVVELRDVIRIDTLENLVGRDLPVVGPEESLRDRTDDGVVINKVFTLNHRDADSIADVLVELIPTWGRAEVEGGSNSIIVVSDLGTAKKLEGIIESLDRPGNYETQTFVLKYSDAATIADYILTLYSASEDSGGGGGGGGRDPRFNPNDPRFQGGDRESRGGGGTASAGGGATELRVVPNTRANTVTVQAAPDILRDIERQIDVWDAQFERGELMRIYTLEYMDAVVVRNILREVLAQGGSLTGGQMRTLGGQGGGVPGTSGSGTGGAVRLQDLYHVDAEGGSNRLIVFAKTPASFDYFDDIIEDLDQPGARTIPLVIELKHADAQELAQELNIAFAPPGSGMQFQGQQEGLEEFEGASQFSQDDTTGSTGGTGLGGGGDATNLDFWWTSARAGDEEQGTQSELVERVRVMPIFRRNALLIVGPPYYQEMMAEMVRVLDQPGRQVLITAIIVEVQLDDSTSLGVRWGTSALGGTGDNQIRAGGSFTGTENDILDELFDTSVLEVNADISVVLNALATESNLRVLSEPRIFTADNQQANFFDGQDIQFVSDSISDIQTGNLNTSFEFRQVGITLSVRPRITVSRDIDLLVNLELSSLSPITTQSGGQIIDQRVTSTRAILKDGQTIVISGILREQESDVIRKVPLLGDIPLIGLLFTSIDVTQERSEILAFITPIVVDNTEENDELNEEFRQRADELQRPLDELVEDPEGETRVWDSNPEAQPHTEDIENMEEADDDGEMNEAPVEDDDGGEDEASEEAPSRDDANEGGERA